jgi:hypothetical protein
MLALGKAVVAFANICAMFSQKGNLGQP